MREDPIELALCQKAVEEGILLFNQKKFHEAYNVWEERWQNETTSYADLLKGLLQISFAFFKIKEGNYNGVHKLLTSAEQVLMGYPEIVFDIDISEIRSLALEWTKKIPQ